MNPHKNKILAIGAHPDDIELSCLGSLLKWRDDNEIHILVLSGGEKWVGEQSHEALSSALRPERIVVQSGFDFGGLKNTHAIVTLLDRWIDNYGIDTIISHSEWDTHPDHLTSFRIVRSAARRKPITILNFQALSSTPEFRTTMLVDVSDFLGKKIATLQKLTAYKNVEYFQETWIRAWHKDRFGLQVGFSDVEGFHVLQMFSR